MKQEAAILALVTFLAIATEAQSSSKGGNCPMKSSVNICIPRCNNDFECSGNHVCCPNVCGSSSCVNPSPVHTGSNRSGYDSLVYCGGVRCRPYQKCELDRNTKHEKCVRRYTNSLLT